MPLQTLVILGSGMQKQRAEKRSVKREKREAAQREAQKAAEAFLQISPRKAPGRRAQHVMEPSSAPASGRETPLPEVCLQEVWQTLQSPVQIAASTGSVA